MRNHLFKNQNILPFFLKANKHFFSTYVAPLNLVKQLREETSSPITECKKALELHNGDLVKAKEYLKEKGLSQAQKKLTRTAKEGVIGVFHNKSTRITAIAEINCETDFVARTDLFTNFVAELVRTAANVPTAFKLSDTKSEQLEKQIEEFSAKNNLSQSLFPEHINLSITDTRQLVISKLQENIKIRRIMTIKQEENTAHGIYVHNTLKENIGSSACVVEVSSKTNNHEGLQLLSNNLAMQILGTKPQYLDIKDIPKEVLKEESEKIKKELASSLAGKPENVVEKIIEGKLKRVYQESVLNLMDYILSPDGEEISVQQYIKQQEKELSAAIQINFFNNWLLGSD